MSDAIKRAEEFLNRQRDFRLGELLTESFHPKTLALSQTAKDDLPAAIRLLQSVDDDIPPAMEKVLKQDTFQELIEAFIKAMSTGKRIFFTGCGATGRLSILLEAAWRRFWRNSKQMLSENIPDLENHVFSVMAGGDFALIKMPSGEIRKFRLNCYATIGQVGNVERNNISLGKAGRTRWLGRRPRVRGVAMNPIDHPMGGGEGKSSGGRHPCSPWGQLTKGLKTRKKNKKSDVLIVKRRK